MRRPIFAFWVAFWFAALVGVPAIALMVGASLAFWFDFPERVILDSLFLGLSGFFVLVALLVLLDGRHRISDDEPVRWWAIGRWISMSRSTQRLVAGVLWVLVILVILNPGYRSFSGSGPNGEFRTKKFTLWSTHVSTRVVADKSGIILIKHE
jgi:hypothetical protein